MDPNNPNNDTSQEVQVPNSSKLRSILKTRNLLIATVIIVVTIAPVLFFSVKTSTENKSISKPSEIIKPTILPFPSEGDYVKNQLIIQYRKGKSPADSLDSDEKNRLASALSKLGVISQEKLIKDQESNLQNYYVLTFSENIDIKVATKGLSEIPEIYTVEPNASFSLFNK